MKSIIGFDYALTHGALVAINTAAVPYTFRTLLVYNKNHHLSTPLKTPLGFIPAQAKIIYNNIVAACSGLNYPRHIAIDFSAHTFFKARTIQTVYQAYITGFLQSKLETIGHDVYLVEPAQIRDFVGAKRNEKKLEVQLKYIENHPIQFTDEQLQNDDVVDAGILAYWLYQRQKESN